MYTCTDSHTPTCIYTQLYTHTYNIHIYIYAHRHILIHAHTYILKGHRILSSSRNARKAREQDFENEQSKSGQNYFIELAHEEDYQQCK